MWFGQTVGNLGIYFSDVVLVVMMKRVLILGPSGSGKSTVGDRLSRILGIPVIHLDQHYWKPGWVDTSQDEWRTKVSDLIKSDSWVMDGNYTSTLKLRATAADTLIFIDIPRRLSYLRIFTRFLRFRGKTRPDVTEDCPEKIDCDFIRWIWHYPRTRKPVILRFLEKQKTTKTVVVLKGQREVETFLYSLREQEDVQKRVGNLSISTPERLL
ncbi:MAG: DNA topology modulation protein [Candidatus Thorarchaeota archaeon]|nr:DNA topology modulation protein [Candidatus Thorarchaeota archaeon]